MKRFCHRRVICSEELDKHLEHWQKYYKCFEIVSITQPECNVFDVIWSYEE